MAWLNVTGAAFVPSETSTVTAALHLPENVAVTVLAVVEPLSLMVVGVGHQSVTVGVCPRRR